MTERSPAAQRDTRLCDPEYPPCASFSALPAARLRPATLEDGKRTAAVAGSPPDARPTTGGRAPDPGVDMATKSTASRRTGPAAAMGIGVIAGVLVARVLQHRALEALHLRLAQLEHTAHTQRHTNLAHQQRLHWELLSKAIDDPELAEVLDLYETPVSPKQRRQYLFANALYTNLLFNYRIGNISHEEFFKHVRGFLQNPAVREYWYATRQQRASLADTEEAELGQMVDDLLQQLEEADTEEWWVVGEPPADDGDG